jgi:hypothetical protein
MFTNLRNAAGRSFRLKLAMSVVAAFALATLGTSTETRANGFVVNGPDGSLGIANANGGYDYYYPDRMNPFANIPVPGSKKMTPNGPVWLGWDGKVHGNIQDPNTGDMHIRYAPGAPSVKEFHSTPVQNEPYFPAQQQRPVYNRHRMTVPLQGGLSNHRPYSPYGGAYPTGTPQPVYLSR